jgi:hypothetical protein
MTVNNFKQMLTESVNKFDISTEHLYQPDVKSFDLSFLTQLNEPQMSRSNIAIKIPDYLISDYIGISSQYSNLYMRISLGPTLAENISQLSLIKTLDLLDNEHRRNLATNIQMKISQKIFQTSTQNPTENLIENPTQNLIENPTENLIENLIENPIENPNPNLIENPTENPIQIHSQTNVLQTNTFTRGIFIQSTNISANLNQIHICRLSEQINNQR